MSRERALVPYERGCHTADLPCTPPRRGLPGRRSNPSSSMRDPMPARRSGRDVHRKGSARPPRCPRADRSRWRPLPPREGAREPRVRACAASLARSIQAACRDSRVAGSCQPCLLGGTHACVDAGAIARCTGSCCGGVLDMNSTTQSAQASSTRAEYQLRSITVCAAIAALCPACGMDAAGSGSADGTAGTGDHTAALEACGPVATAGGPWYLIPYPRCHRSTFGPQQVWVKHPL